MPTTDTDATLERSVDALEGGRVFHAKTREARLAAANWLLLVIASTGRRLFRHGESVAVFRINSRRNLVWQSADGARFGRPELLSPHRMPHGSTMRTLLVLLAAYIDDGERIPAGVFGPWGETDLWGYGDDMAIVRRAAQRAVLLAPATAAGARA